MGSCIFSMVRYRGHDIFVLLGGGQNVLLLFAMNLASPTPPGINNKWSFISSLI